MLSLLISPPRCVCDVSEVYHRMELTHEEGCFKRLILYFLPWSLTHGGAHLVFLILVSVHTHFCFSS